jgi:tRNA-dihydrouridine synthase B
MVSGKGLLYNDKNTEKLLVIYDEEKPVAFQIFGSEPGVIGDAAKKLSCRENALLDINMGCPVPKIVKNGEGSALLKNPELVERIVEAAVREAGKPVTVKIRAGWDAANVNAAEIARAAESAGASAIAVHGRTREQYYSGKADWAVIKDVKKAVSLPVIGSGDVFSACDAMRMLEETGCDFVMVARGALGNPWIFREAVSLWRNGSATEPPRLDEKKEMICRHLTDLVAEKGEGAAVREMRKHIGWYLKGVPGSAEIRRRANSVKEAGKMLELIEGI